MRTKTLVLAAAISAAGIVASMAQSNVYSVNVVGYINLNLQKGFNLIANQLDVDGTGLNNTVFTTFTNQLPIGSTVFAFSGGAFASPAASYTKTGWGGGLAAANAALNPGSGVFVQVPSAVAVTLVGNVLQGSLSQSYNAGFNITSSKVPQSGLIQTDLGYSPSIGDSVFRYDAVGQAYTSPTPGFTKTGWASPPGQPNLAVGEAVFLQAAKSGTWNRNFTVQ